MPRPVEATVSRILGESHNAIGIISAYRKTWRNEDGTLQMNPDGTPHKPTYRENQLRTIELGRALEAKFDGPTSIGGKYPESGVLSHERSWLVSDPDPSRIEAVLLPLAVKYQQEAFTVYTPGEGAELLYPEVYEKDDVLKVLPNIAKREPIGELKFNQNAEIASIIRNKQLNYEAMNEARSIHEWYFDKKLPPPDTAPESDFKLDAYYKFIDLPRKDFELLGGYLKSPWCAHATMQHCDIFVLRYQGKPILAWGPVRFPSKDDSSDYVEWHIAPTNALIDRLNQRLPPGVRPMPHDPKYDVAPRQQPTAESIGTKLLA